MRLLAAALAVSLAGLAVTPAPQLGVLRSSPADGADPTAIVSVAFDRPVAGQLDGTVDPKTIFSISPAVPGLVEWQDPITIRFTPSAPLVAGRTYTVTVANTFQAMDGSRLSEPYRFSFRVSGPRVLAGVPAGPGLNPPYLTPDATFEVVISTPVDLDVLSRLVYLELARTCGVAPIVRLRAVAARPVNDKDIWNLREAGGWQRNRAADPLRRVVRLVPEHPLPLACDGWVIVPASIDSTSTAPAQRWPFTVYHPLKVVEVSCVTGPRCPAGYTRVRFSTPVRGTEVLRAVTLVPPVKFTVSDSTEELDNWVLEGNLAPRTTYTVRVDGSLHDVFAQQLGTTVGSSFTTTPYAPSLTSPVGTMLVERAGFRTLAVRHVNLDTVYTSIAAVPESLESRVLAAPGWNLQQLWPLVSATATTRAVPVESKPDVPLVSAIRVPAYNALRPAAPSLTLVRMSRSRTDTSYEGRPGLALVQVTDLGIAVKLGASEAGVWVTTAHDGKPARGAAVVLYGRTGQVRARGVTDAQGLARLTGLAVDTAGTGDNQERFQGGFEGYVSATLADDRAVAPVSSYDWQLAPWHFNVYGADQPERLPAAAAVFTERGIYRPGESVHAKAIVRVGPLGALNAPARGDSLRWVFRDREEGVLRDTVVAPSAFGTDDQTFPLKSDLPLGTYAASVSLRRDGQWVELASTSYRVAEYRPPEFLVTASVDSGTRFAGDSLATTIEARYLFGAPMGRAKVEWTMRRTSVGAWALAIPNTEGFAVGENGWWWEDEPSEGTRPDQEVSASGTDTLDLGGRLALRVPLPAPIKGRPAQVTLEATVTDVNRQTVSTQASALVHPAAIYLGARTEGGYFWKSGTPVEVQLIAVTPAGRRVPGVAIAGTVVRSEWHRVQRERDGVDEQVGGWVADTVAHCAVTSAADPVPCRFTPPGGGSYIVTLTAHDDAGRLASTSFYRWATGPGWIPWNDEDQFKMDVVPDKTSYSVGDTATILFASPFADAEAWMTVEREGMLEQRRLTLTSGSTSIRLPLTEAHVPNVFVSIVVARGRSAPPGGLGDPGRPTIRVGYAQLLVTPKVKRLQVSVTPVAAEYRPGDSARVRLAVRDAGNVGRRSEVTLWAVDEGVLALTGYRTPDPVSLIYRSRGLGMHLGSDLTSVAEQLLQYEGMSIKGELLPGGGGGLGGGDVLRSRFSSVAFFLGSVVTDAAGNALAVAKLPDNLTTFRLMAVAVTAGDRYGSGESSLLVTRPLLARPALPRFLRRDDQLTAGVVVNQRSGEEARVRVRARTRGTRLAGDSAQVATLAAGRGSEIRFAFQDTASDSSAFRFDVTNGTDSDAVLTVLPVRPSFAPRAHTAAGVTTGADTIQIALPEGTDPTRSRVTIGVGTTPLVIVGGMYRELAVYPFDCSEQVSDELLPVIALYRAGTMDHREYAPRDALRQIRDGVAALSQRQRPDGGIGLWASDDWTTPWLSAYAGEALLEARAAGVPVSDSVLTRLADYLYRSVHQSPPIPGPLATWFGELRYRLGEQVAAVDYLSRFGRVDLAGENELLRVAAQLAWEDRVRLAEVLSRRGARGPARQLLEPIWAATRVEGRRAVAPDSLAHQFYFWSWRRPLARLLSATVAVDSASPLIGPLVETLVEQARGASYWNTQDYGSAVTALVDFTARQRRAVAQGFTVTAGSRLLVQSAPGDTDVLRETERNLSGLIGTDARAGTDLKLVISVNGGRSLPLYYYATVSEIPRERPVTPDQQGIQVERWYEDYTTGKPIVSAVEGALVRVRLRIRISEERRFLALTDPLPAGLEAVDLSLLTVGGLPGPGSVTARGGDEEGEGEASPYLWDWYYGSWDGGWWSPFDHKEMHDDRVSYVATYLWPGTYTATYVARATTPGAFVRPPAHAEEMYNPAVQGRSDGGLFTVTAKP